MDDNRWPSLSEQSGNAWVKWFSHVSDKQSDLSRALDCLNTLYSDTSSDPIDAKTLAAKVKACHRFIGHSKCPSSSACDKIAFRVDILHGWLSSIDVSCGTHWSALRIIGGVLPKLFSLCEGADDRRHVLIHAVRDLTKFWLNSMETVDFSNEDKIAILYPLAMQDQTGVISPVWWWRVLGASHREGLLNLIRHDIDSMDILQPSTVARWKSYEGRWFRLRVKALLEYLEEPWLLSELLAKSALDDFEAAAALDALARANRFREAISLGEKWHRIMPGNSVVGEALLNIYIHDGWDDEAISLLKTLCKFDPNPKWVAELNARFGIRVNYSNQIRDLEGGSDTSI